MVQRASNLTAMRERNNGCLPDAFVARLQAELGTDQAGQIAATMAAPKDVAYWLNPLRDGDAPPLGRAVAGLRGVFACGHADRERLVRHPAATSGRIYLLNPSSAAAVCALAPEPGEAVLDLAAAPGGKTLLAAARMANTGTITAVEPVKSRFFRLRANLERCGVANACCRLDDGRNMGRIAAERFDRVLLDAPCSSEARFRIGDAATLRYWSRRKVKEAGRKQRGLIRAAFRCLRPGGTLVYCTCAYSRYENEAVVAYLLRREPAARIVPLNFAHVPALPAVGGSIDGTIRILPNALFDGLFIARLTKCLGRDVGG